MKNRFEITPIRSLYNSKIRTVFAARVDWAVAGVSRQQKSDADSNKSVSLHVKCFGNAPRAGGDYAGGFATSFLSIWFDAAVVAGLWQARLLGKRFEPEIGDTDVEGETKAGWGAGCGGWANEGSVPEARVSSFSSKRSEQGVNL